MIHKLVEDAYAQIDQYEVNRREEVAEMFYCLGRLESAFGYKTAMLTLNKHLDTHYRVKGDIPSLTQTAQSYFPHENGIDDMLKEV